MFSEKSTSTKRTTKQTAATGEAAKAEKSASIRKVAAKPVAKTTGAGKPKAPTAIKAKAPAAGKAKTPAAGKATTAKRATKPAVAKSEPTITPKKAASAAKSLSTSAEKAVDTLSIAKPAAKVRVARKAATSKAESNVKKTAGAARKIVKEPLAPPAEGRHRLIAIAAYYRAERRHFVPGYEQQDWLDAEAEVDELLGKA